MTSGIGIEHEVAAAWIEDTLKASTTLTDLIGADGVWESVGPDDQPYPFVTYSMQDASDLVVVGLVRVWTDTLWLVRGVTKAERPTTKLKQVAAAIDEALITPVGGVVTEPSGRTLMCTRERPHRMRSTEQSVAFQYLGGIYRIYSQGA